ncbi:MAG: hypothetical protein HOI65_10495 [Opitutae bacterium]|nr:hypothetical protein [Opitutae bacterium]MBT5691528.1 hypothetical protein [Opitutae bacterium]
MLRRFESLKIRLSDKAFIKSALRVFRFFAWRLRQKAKMEKHAKTVQASSTKAKTGDRMAEWAFLLLSPNKPASIWMLQLGLVLLVLTPLAAIGYHMARSWRIDNLHEASIAALKEKDLETAWRTAHAAHLMRPRNIEILRALRDASETLEHSRALEWSLKLSEHKKATPDDQLALARLAISMGERSIAEKAHASYIRKPGWDAMEADSLRLFLAISRGRSAKPEALALARGLLGRGCRSIEVCHAYWALCLDELDPALAPEGLAHMQTFIEEKNDLGRSALRHLLRSGKIEGPARIDYARKLWQFPNPTQKDALLYMDAVHHGKPFPTGSLQEYFKGKSESFSSPMNVVDLTHSLAWLGRRKDAADFYLAQEHDRLSQVEFNFLDSMFANKIHDSGEVDEILARTIKNATVRDLDTLRQLIPLHTTPNAMVSLLERMEGEVDAPVGVRHLLALCYQRLGRGGDLEDLLARTPLPSLNPLPQVAEQACRLKALYRQDVPACRRLAEKLVSRYPQTVSYRYVLALCYHLSERPGEAYALLKPHLAGQLPACPSQRLVGALSFAGVGRNEDASNWMPLKHKEMLLEPEKELLGWITVPVD